uniref:Uncharacterized protein n=1 Tax=Loxodonta africana TaxID=9785 RepID=G3UH23_LOXAF
GQRGSEADRMDMKRESGGYNYLVSATQGSQRILQTVICSFSNISE